MVDSLLRTKIICTIGPACRDPAILKELIKAGMRIARINFSHGDHATHAADIKNIRTLSVDLDQPVGILADLQGPKLRLGTLPPQGVPLQTGADTVLTIEPQFTRSDRIPVQYHDLPQMVQPGEHILIDDGLIELQVKEHSDQEILCKVIAGGIVTSNKGLNLPQAALSILAITPKDIEDLHFALEQGVDWIALSFVRHAQDITQLKSMIAGLTPQGQLPVPVIAKIEKPEGVTHLEEILEVVDGIMVARGDLAVETSPEEVPLVQKKIIHTCNLLGIPVITATQMLESMTRNPRPTRAEATDVANAILDGTDATMLSGETAVGTYPVETVRTMARIALKAEAGGATWRLPLSQDLHSPSIAVSVAHAAVGIARELSAQAIVCPTASGYSARMVARFRPTVSIIAATPSPEVQRRLALVWGVLPLLAPRQDNSDLMIQDALQVACNHNLLASSDLVVVTAGAAGQAPGTTDLIRVLRVP
ncbi:MAG: pyruvate kinase [Chloroflexi bacterium]|nr:pyruvate kinase [Chloroflexota bacterium]